ncbi:MAG: class I SAM-dependent methyltransferase [Bryobacteraceae bacterium]
MTEPWHSGPIHPPPHCAAWSHVGLRFNDIGLTAAFARRTPPRHAALASDPPYVALRVFRDGGLANEEELARLFGPELLSLCAPVVGRFRLDVARGIYLFSDWPERPGPDTVLPPGETTALLLDAALARLPPDARVWDLGCGSGTLSLLLEGGVTGSDVNPRAVALAEWNSAVNGLTHARFRLGSLDEPVRGDRFDLIVSQPPFLAGGSSLFLHGGARGDELARAILELAPRYLTRNGLALIFADWLLAPGERIEDRLPRVDGAMRVWTTSIDGAAWAASYGVADMPARVAQCLIEIRGGCGESVSREFIDVGGNWGAAVGK